MTWALCSPSGTFSLRDFINPVTGIIVPTDTVSLFLNDYFANVGSNLNTMNGVVMYLAIAYYLSFYTT